jgi:Fe-S-cluster containining protein
MTDGTGRRFVKKIALFVYAVRLKLHRARAMRRGDIRYELGGRCDCSGSCCEAPGIQVGVLTWYVPVLRNIFLWWHRTVNGFESMGKDVAARGFIFRCTHFELETRRCDSYGSRPGMCRDYPRVLLEQANPVFFPDCGFKPLATGRQRFVQILQEQSLSPEQMQKLKKGLYLED